MEAEERGALIAQLEAELAEIEYALNLLEKADKARTVFVRVPGGAMIEVSKDEAVEFLTKRMNQILSLLSKLRKEKGA